MPDYFESGVFTNNQPAWHGMGCLLEGKLYNLEEALTLANMNWRVEKRDLFYADTNGEYVKMSDRQGVVRVYSDGKENPIGTVSPRYQVLQNDEAFSIFEPFLREKLCFITSCISLMDGKKVCMVGQIEDNVREVTEGDTVATYLLAATSHDGSMASVFKYTNVRTVCANTLAAALFSNGEVRSVRHTKDQKDKIKEIQQSIDIYRSNFNNDIAKYQNMLNIRMDLDAMRGYLETVFEKELLSTARALEIPRDEMDLDSCRITKSALNNFMFSPDLQTDNVANTGWAAFNAVTEAIKNRSSRRDSRYNAIWFGQDGKLLDQAADQILALA